MSGQIESSLLDPQFGSMGLPAGVAELLMSMFFVTVVFLELQRRGGTGPGIGSQVGRYAQNCKQLLKKCAPEAAGLMACLTLAALLRARGDIGVQPSDEAAWEQIKAQWPLLMTADTLLSLQAMLRLVVLLSILLRACAATGPVPLSEEACAIWLGANMARIALAFQADGYKLDGPLGGFLPTACEIAVVPILLVLSRGAIRRAALTLGLVIAAAMAFAYRNHLCLAGDKVSDALFMLAHSLDFLAAIAYLARTALIDRAVKDVSVGFTHLLLPIQQGLAAYYFLAAFDAVPELVGAGYPFEVLHIGNTAALGAYLGASVLHFAEWFDAPPLSV